MFLWENSTKDALFLTCCFAVPHKHYTRFVPSSRIIALEGRVQITFLSPFFFKIIGKTAWRKQKLSYYFFVHLANR